MTKIKLCGLSRLCDIEAVNELKPEYIGFVFASKSKRYVIPKQAANLKEKLSEDIKAVGVFVNEKPEKVAELLNSNLIDMAQLHGDEDEEYIKALRNLSKKTLIKDFSIGSNGDIDRLNKSTADFVLLDSGQGGTGKVFEWELIKDIKKPYFLAGGINVDNARTAIEKFHPYGLDISSGIETDGVKDKEKMADFVRTVRKENKL